MDTLILDGSHRPGGNTGVLLGVLRDAMEERGFSCATLALRDLHIGHCRVCGICNSHPRCPLEDDFHLVLGKALEARALIIGSPVYVGLPSSRVLTLVQRLTWFAHTKDRLLQRKIGAAVVVAGEAGHLTTLNALVDFFLVNGMVVPGSRYWPVGTATGRGEILKDRSAVENIRHLAGTIVHLLEGGKT